MPLQVSTFGIGLLCVHLCRVMLSRLEQVRQLHRCPMQVLQSACCLETATPCSARGSARFNAMGAMGMRGTSVPFGIFTTADAHTAFAMGGGGGLFGRGSSFGGSGSRFGVGDGGGGGFGGGRGFASGGSGQRFPGGGHGSTGLFDLDSDDDMSDEPEEVGKPCTPPSVYQTEHASSPWGLCGGVGELPAYSAHCTTLHDLAVAARSRAHTEQLPQVCCLACVTGDAHS